MRSRSAAGAAGGSHICASRARAAGLRSGRGWFAAAFLLTLGAALVRGVGAALPPGAHARLAAGQLLVAAERLADPNFRRTVVFLLDHDARGALGVIVNRATERHLSDLLSGLPADWSQAVGVYEGGPVERNRVIVLLRPSERIDDPDALGARAVIDGVYASRDTGAIEWAVENLPPEEMRAYVGYAGWGPGQLDREVGNGDWLLVPADPRLVFSSEGTSLWERLLRGAVGTWVRASPSTH